MLSIQERFRGEELTLPADTVNPFKKAEAKKGDGEGHWSLRKLKEQGTKYEKIKS